MASRAQQGGRPGGARFAQFKLVLLGMRRWHAVKYGRGADHVQVNLLSERARLFSDL